MLRQQPLVREWVLLWPNGQWQRLHNHNDRFDRSHGTTYRVYRVNPRWVELNEHLEVVSE